MKNVILTQSQLDKIVRVVSEQWDNEDPYAGGDEDYHRWRDANEKYPDMYELLGADSDELLYSEVDFAELFINNFKKWMVEKYGPESIDYPVRLLLYNHMSDFLLHLGWEQPTMRLWTLADVERFLKGDGYPTVVEVTAKAIKDGKFIRYKTIKPQKLILPKYKKLINEIISEWQLPSYVNINVSEETPHKLVVDVEIDFVRAMKDPKVFERDINSSTVTRLLQKQLKDFGIKVGDRFLGHLRIEDGENYVTDVSWDDWLKNEWAKKIVPGLKKLDKMKLIKSIQVERFTSPLKHIGFRLVMKGVNSFTRADRDYSKDLAERAKNYLAELGYPKIYFVTNA